MWDKGYDIDSAVERFTVGDDRELDVALAQYDIEGSAAHAEMLRSIGMLSDGECAALQNELSKLHELAVVGKIEIEEGVEDIHSQIELMLTRALGETGKKIHSGRSRNDQVLLDLRLFARAELKHTVALVKRLFDALQQASERYKDVLMPGYTHLQVAMPSSFGLWFGAYAEALTDDVQMLLAAYRIINRNPLGSAAGYGSSLPLDREMTTRLLGFDSMCYNVVYAQMERGKSERIVAAAIASVASTVSKFAFDACLYNSQNFGFIHLPDRYTTGSSIMPHKKNPDVFELLRSKCNLIQAAPSELAMVCNNLPSGYSRDMQTTKEIFIPLFGRIDVCLEMAAAAVPQIEVNREILSDKRYDLMFSVEEVNRLAVEGVPFREAYRKVADEIAAGEFVPENKVHHTHAGSIGNLCNDKISTLMDSIIAQFGE